MDKRQSILLEAMEIELNGIELYKSVSEKTDDREASKMFKFLADEELKHYNALKKMFDKGKEVKTELPVMEKISFERIFSDDFKKNLKGRNYEFSAISTGLLLEKNSVNFYRTQKEDATDTNEKELFATLEKWEKEHYKILEREYENLKVKFWEDNNFYPF